MEILEIEKSNLLEDVMIDLGDHQPQAQLNKEDFDKSDVLAIVLLQRNSGFNGIIKPYNLDICGKKMFEWVLESVSGMETKTIACDESSNIVSLIKPLLNGKKTTIVLYSDTPLLSRSTVSEILNYFAISHLNVLKLERGWVFNSEYIAGADSVLSALARNFGTNDFERVFNAKTLEMAKNVLQDKILDFHLNNGVLIDSKLTTFIDATAIIENGVRIAPNNIIKGETYIGKNVILHPNNIIISSIISAGCEIRSSHIVNSKISENMIVGPFEIIEEKES